MNRKSAILRMARIMGAGLSILIIILGIEVLHFKSAHGIYVLVGSWIYIYVFGSYIKRIMEKIDRDYPKDEDSV